MRQRRKPLVTLSAMVMSLISVSIGHSQEAEVIVRKGIGKGYFVCGGRLLDIDALNSRLEDEGYSKLSDSFLTLGGGGHAVIKRVILGGEGHAVIGREETEGGYETSLSGGYFLFDMGYVAYSTGYFDLYPLVGIGGGIMSLKIGERGTPSFDEVLDDPLRSAELSIGGFLLNVAVGADYLLKLEGDGKKESGLVFGLRVGYTFAPVHGNWEMDETEIAGGPEVGITGPYIQVMIGGGSIGAF